MEVTISTDSYPEETSWSIIDSTGAVVASRADFSSTGKTYTDKVCIAQNSCYTFDLEDSYGDGLTDNGSCEVKVDGVLVNDISGSFDSLLSRQIGSCGCASGFKKVTVGLKTDNWGMETRFRIKKKNNGKWRGKAWELTDFTSNADIVASKCLDATKCYKFFIFDSAQDGIVGDDSYFVEWDGSMIKESNFNNGFRETSPPFGNC